MIDTKQMAKYIFEEYANYYSEADIKKLAKHLDEIKAEAIKEFAEKLKKVSQTYGRGYALLVTEFQVDSIVKEMIGE